MNPDETVSITDVFGDKFDYHAMMNAEPGELGNEVDPDVTTVAGGDVILNVSRTFYVDPAAPRWQSASSRKTWTKRIRPWRGTCVIAGMGPDEKGTEPCRDIIILDSPAAVALAHEHHPDRDAAAVTNPRARPFRGRRARGPQQQTERQDHDQPDHRRHDRGAVMPQRIQQAPNERLAPARGRGLASHPEHAGENPFSRWR